MLLLREKLRIGPSPVHGMGIFAVEPLPAKAVLWAMGNLDRGIPPESATQEQLHFGFISNATGQLVICGDDARWWNFGHPANCDEAEVYIGGERIVVTLREIAAGEELLISEASDADATRKLGYTSAYRHGISERLPDQPRPRTD